MLSPSLATMILPSGTACGVEGDGEDDAVGVGAGAGVGVGVGAGAVPTGAVTLGAGPLDPPQLASRIANVEVMVCRISVSPVSQDMR
jgi:hypothetical protein